MEFITVGCLGHSQQLPRVIRLYVLQRQTAQHTAHNSLLALIFHKVTR